MWIDLIEPEMWPLLCMAARPSTDIRLIAFLRRTGLGFVRDLRDRLATNDPLEDDDLDERPTGILSLDLMLYLQQFFFWNNALTMLIMILSIVLASIKLLSIKIQK